MAKCRYIKQFFLFLAGFSLGVWFFKCFGTNTPVFVRFKYVENNYITPLEGFKKEHKHQDKVELANEIAKKVRIFCLVITSKNQHDLLTAMKNTWLKRCNKYVIMSTEKDEHLPSINLNISISQDNLWIKTKKAFTWIYKNHLNDFDWFVKVNADSFVVMENLRFMLLSHSPEDPLHFGCNFWPYKSGQLFHSEGDGYVLSREAVRRFVEIAIPNKKRCSQMSSGSESIKMTRCLRNVDVIPGDSRDADAKHRFVPFFPDQKLGMSPKQYIHTWFSDIGQADTPRCCSDYVILFERTTEENMYVLEYLIYHLKPFGADSSFESIGNETLIKTAFLISKSENERRGSEI